MKVIVRDSGQEWTASSAQRVVIGTAPDCDIVLPRAAFVRLGRRELNVWANDGAPSIESLHREHRTTINGVELGLSAMTVEPGEHVVTVDDRSFALVIS